MFYSQGTFDSSRFTITIAVVSHHSLSVLRRFWQQLARMTSVLVRLLQVLLAVPLGSAMKAPVALVT